MDFNYLMKLTLLFLIFSTVSCTKSNNQMDKPEKNQIGVDSFKVGSAMKSHTFIGKKIYPVEDKSDIFINATKTGVFLCLNANDTLYVLLNNKILCNSNVVEDTLFNYISKYYSIEYDIDLPYFVYLRNDKDTITLINNKNEDKYSFESAIINDTIFDIQSVVKVGYSKFEFMNKIGINKMSNIPDCIFLIPISIVDSAWYTKYLIKDREKFSSQTNCNDYFTIEIKFDKSKIICFKLGNWFGDW